MPSAIDSNLLAEFQKELVGNWMNMPFGQDEDGMEVGGEDNPLSYNIMPLPETSDPDGYILKNFKYSERIKFNNDNVNDTLAIAAEAPNRGGLVSQNARALFYEQQVKFAEGPAKGKVVHVENGAWLWFPRFVQQDGPYPGDIDKMAVSDALSQPGDVSVAKLISIPHGNSILALGSFDTVTDDGGARKAWIDAPPVIPDAPFPYPTPAVPVGPPPNLASNLNVDYRYTTESSNMDNYQNPHPDLTQMPNWPLQQAVAIIQPDAYMHWHVTTEPLPNGKGHVMNIPFEHSVADVTEYWAEYWLLGKDDNRYLAYTQTILMVLTVKDKKYVFPHVTCNTLTKTSS